MRRNVQKPQSGLREQRPPRAAHLATQQAVRDRKQMEDLFGEGQRKGEDRVSQ